MRLLATVLLLVGCGPGPDFTGYWTGVMTLTASCPGDKPSSVMLDATWTLAQRDDTVTITPDGTCGSFTADVVGSAASIRAKTCPSGFVFTGGRLVLLTPEKLDATLNSKSGTCDGSIAGVLNLN